MQFGMSHFAYLGKYAKWHQKQLKNTHFFCFTFGAPYKRSFLHVHVKVCELGDVIVAWSDSKNNSSKKVIFFSQLNEDFKSRF